MDFREFLVDKLENDEVLSLVLGSRIYPLVLPDELDENVAANVPFIIYQLVSEPVNGGKFPSVQLRICSTNYGDLVLIAARIEEMFGGQFKYHGNGLDVEAASVQPSIETTDDSTGVCLLVRLIEVKFALRRY